MAIADELLVVVRANTTQAVSSLGAVESKLSGLAGAASAAMGRIGMALTTGLTLPLLGVGGSAAKMAIGFETGMAQIQALVGVTDDELDELSEAALRMGREFGVSAQEAAEGLFFLKSAGLDNATAIETMELAAIGAASGLGDMTTLANGMTTVMTNFGLTGEEAMDKFFVAVKKAKVEPEEMAHILNLNAASAASVGMSFDDLAGVTAFLTVAMGDSSAAGTSMRGMLTKVIKPSEQAKDALAEIGLTGEEFAEMMSTDLVGTLHILDEAFTGIGKNDWMGKVFEDSEAIKGVAAILNQTEEDVRAFGEEVSQSAGATATAWEIMSETAGVRLKQSVEGLKSALIPLGQSIVDLVIPGVERLAELATDFVEKWQNLSKETQTLILKMTGLTVALGPAFLIFSKLLKAITLIASPIGLIALAVGAVVFVLWKLGVTMEDVTAFMGKAWEVIVEAFETARAALEPILEDVAAFITMVFTGVAEFLDEHWEEIVSMFQRFFEVFKAIWDDIWAFLGPMVERIVEFATRLFGDLIAWFDENFYLIKDTIVKVLNIIQALWDVFWPAIKTAFEVVWNALAPIVETAFGVVLDIVTFLMAVFNGDWKVAWQAVKDIVSGIWEGIKRVIRGAFDVIGAIVMIGMGLIKRTWTTIWGVIKGAVEGVWNGIKWVIQNGVNAAIAGLEWLMRRSSEVLNHIIQAWNNANLFLNFADIPKVPTDISLPRVTLGDGGTVMRDSIARVGERGRPETVFLPAGSRVDSGQGGGALIGQLVIHSNAHPVDIARELGWELMRRG